MTHFQYLWSALYYGLDTWRKWSKAPFVCCHPIMITAQRHSGQRKPSSLFTSWHCWILRLPGLKSGWCVPQIKLMQLYFWITHQCLFGVLSSLMLYFDPYTLFCFSFVHVCLHLSAWVLQQDCGSQTSGGKIQVSGEWFTPQSISLCSSFVLQRSLKLRRKNKANQHEMSLQ